MIPFATDCSVCQCVAVSAHIASNMEVGKNAAMDTIALRGRIMGALPARLRASGESCIRYFRRILRETRARNHAIGDARFCMCIVPCRLCASSHVYTGTGVAPPYERAAQAALEVLTQAEERARGALSRTLRVSSLMASGAFSQ